MKTKSMYLAISFVLIAITSCKKETVRQPDLSYNPVILPANFTNSTNLTNIYFPYQTGKKYIYEATTPAGLEHIEYERIATTKIVQGINCVVILDKVWLAGKLVEKTFDWYAQDNAGNVWYMGEDVENYKPDGSLLDKDGSWEGGINGAKPGYIMLATPMIGNAYRQEYLFNEAEDRAEVVEKGIMVTVPLGTYTNCIKTKEWTELEPGVVQYKFYAPNIGMIKDTKDNVNLMLKEIL